MDAEQRRAQAVGSLREVERRQAAGEIDAAEADELIELFAERAAAATAELRGAATPRRSLPLPALVVAAVLALTVLVVVLMQLGDDGGQGGRDGAAGQPPPAGQQRDLSQVTNEEMEEVVAANPGVVAMRLALVERYLDDGDLAKANEHAAEALRHDPSPADRQRAEVYLGWTSALLGDGAEGERLLRAAVERDPADRNARWYLANVLADRGEPDEAAALLRALLDEDIPAAQRTVIEDKLANLG